MIKVLYRDIESVFKINGGLSALFKVERGVRQGCALSAMLYALSIKPLLHRIRSVVSGPTLPGFNTAHVLSTYADDVIVLVRAQKDVDGVGKSVTYSETMSMAKVNWTKSEALAVGQWSKGLKASQLYQEG